MAVTAAVEVKLFVGALRVDNATSANITPEVATLTANRWGLGSFAGVAAGITSYRADITAFQDWAANDIAATFRNLTGSSEVLSVCPVGSAAGSLAQIGRVLVTGAPWSGSIGELPTVQIPLRGFGSPVGEGRVTIAETTAITGTLNGAAQQLGAVTASTKRVYAAVHILDIQGTSPTLQPILQSDDNSGFSSATSQATGTAQGAVGTQWLASGWGPFTDDYWRVRLVAGGTVTSASVLAAVAIA